MGIFVRGAVRTSSIQYISIWIAGVIFSLEECPGTRGSLKTDWRFNFRTSFLLQIAVVTWASCASVGGELQTDIFNAERMHRHLDKCRITVNFSAVLAYHLCDQDCAISLLRHASSFSDLVCVH